MITGILITSSVTSSVTSSGPGAVTELAVEMNRQLGAEGEGKIAAMAPSAISVEQPEAVHVLAIEDLTEEVLQRVHEVGASLSLYLPDLKPVCAAGQLLDCDRSFCRNPGRHAAAHCFFCDLPDLGDQEPGTILERVLPDTTERQSALLARCRVQPPAVDAGALRAATSRRQELISLLACVDFFILPNSCVRMGLEAFGIAGRGLWVEAEEASLQERASIIIAAHQSGRLPRQLKWRQDRRNGVLMLQDLAHQRLAWESRPLHIEFSSNNVCNLRCVMCLRPAKVKMEEAEVRDVCSQLLPHASVLTPSAGSEPILGDFDLLCSLSELYEVQLSTITNATLLTPEHYRKMRKNLGRLHISFDSCEKDVYEQIRVGAKFDKTVENIRKITGLAAEDGVEVLMGMVVLQPNWNKMAEYVEFAADLGASSVSLQQLIPQMMDMEAWDIEGLVSAEELQREVDRAIEAARRCEINLHVGLGTPQVHRFCKRTLRPFKWDYLQKGLRDEHPKVCYQMATLAKVTPEGNVYPCCVGDDAVLMGNLKEQSFEEIWNAEPYQRLRLEMFSGKLRKICRECTIS